jgi:hypothetical protein
MNDSLSQKSQFDERIFRFAAPSRAALVAWRQSMPSFPVGRISRAELTQLLIREDSRPILLFGALLRVATCHRQDFVWFEEATTLESQLKVFLRATPEQVRQIKWNPDDLDSYGRDNYAVIAKIQAVEHVPTGGVFFAVGQCVDLMHLSFVDFWTLAYPRWLSVF